MTALVWAANVLGWPVLHFAIASVALRTPARTSSHATHGSLPRAAGNEMEVFTGIGSPFANGNPCSPMVHPGWGLCQEEAPRAQSRLPCAISHRNAPRRNRALVHARLPAHLLFWNPPWARWVMAVYALAANLPCIWRSAITALFSIVWRELDAALWPVHEPDRRQGGLARRRRRYLVHLLCAHDEHDNACRYIARIQLWTARIRARAESQERVFTDEY